MYFNVFEAAPENERDGPSHHQAAQNAGAKVGNRYLACFFLGGRFPSISKDVLTRVLAPRILFINALLGPACRPPSLDVRSAITHVGPYRSTVLLIIVIWDAFGRYIRVVSCLALSHPLRPPLVPHPWARFIVAMIRSCRRG